MPSPDCRAKVLIVGESGVGKSTILSSYNGEPFNRTYIQTSERDIKKSIVQVGRRSVELQIWDTPGNPQCRTVTAAYMLEDVKGVIFVFDVTSGASYRNVQHWVQTVYQYAGKQHGNYKYVFAGNKNDNELEREVPIESEEQYAGKEHGNYKYVFVGNKNDNELEREVPIESGEQLAEKYNGAYFDASARTKKNINEIFQKMAEFILGETTDQRDLNNGVNKRGDVDGLDERKDKRFRWCPFL